MKSFLDYGITFQAGATGELKTTCPQCSGQRRKKNYPCLNVNVEKGVWHCWHCDWSGTLKDGTWNKPQSKRPVYSRPAPVQAPKISEAWRNWLAKRGISDNTIAENKLMSATVYMPQVETEVDAVCFPFFRNGEMINCKYRDKDKNFRMVAGAERLLYGFDDLDTESLIWVEGEIDKLSVYEAGFKSCVSVPDGAPAVGTKNYSSKFDYFDTCIEKLKAVKHHIIAVDSDAPGKALQAELIRRLGPAICSTVTWPDDRKDANEVLLKFGKDAVSNAILSAMPAPVEGVFYVKDVYEEILNLYQSGEVGGVQTGWENMKHLYTVRPGDFTVITGIPGHGKSEWADALMVNIAKTQGWRFALCSPENQPIKLHIKKLAEKWTGRPFFEREGDRMTVAEMNQAIEDLNQYFSFILPEEPTIDCVLDRARSEVLRNGINGLLLDPWNELEHSRPAAQTETEYISDSLRKMRNFARQNNIALWVVAHPTKMQRVEKGSSIYEVPTPYDIAGSAHWRNKADNCITIFRNENSVDVHVQKIRVKEIGKTGIAQFKYKISTGEYFPMKG